MDTELDIDLFEVQAVGVDEAEAAVVEDPVFFVHPLAVDALEAGRTCDQPTAAGVPETAEKTGGVARHGAELGGGGLDGVVLDLLPDADDEAGNDTPGGGAGKDLGREGCELLRGRHLPGPAARLVNRRDDGRDRRDLETEPPQGIAPDAGGFGSLRVHARAMPI